LPPYATAAKAPPCASEPLLLLELLLLVLLSEPYPARASCAPQTEQMQQHEKHEVRCARKQAMRTPPLEALRTIGGNLPL
jgi:hypothetical protein